MATGYTKLAFEASAVGNETVTPTQSTKILYPPLISIAPDLKPNPMERDDENRNLDEPWAVLTEAYDPAWSFESRLYPDTAGFFFKWLLGAPVTQVGNGTLTDLDTIAVPVGGFIHTWTAPFGQGINPQTVDAVVAYKDQSTFFRYRGLACTALSIDSPANGGVRLKASGIGTFAARTADPALTPAYESPSIRPFTRSGLALPTWLASSALFEDFNISVANPADAQRTLAVASKFPDDVEKGDPPIIFTGSVPKRYLNSADWDALLNATGFAAEARWTSDTIIASGYPYKLIIKFTNIQYVDGGANPLENKRRIGASYNWKATNATGTAGHAIVQVVNATTSYA